MLKFSYTRLLQACLSTVVRIGPTSLHLHYIPEFCLSSKFLSTYTLTNVSAKVAGKNRPII